MKLFLLIIITILVIIQLYRPLKNSSSTTAEAQDFLIVENVPQSLTKIFKNSCYDCHSNNTKYAWYDNIVPFSWYVSKNIKRAKFSLNFSEWGLLEPWQRRLFIQGGIPYDINIDKMPPQNYLIMHPEAKISDKEKKQIEAWISTIDLRKD